MIRASNKNERLDYYFPTRWEPGKNSINPRAVLIDEDENVALVPHYEE